MEIIEKIRAKGVYGPLKRRAAWYRGLLMVNNRQVGKLVETFGNKVAMDGLTYSVDCPLISTGHKSTLFFGLHEIEERALAKSFVPPDVPVIEFGGGLGVVSCLINSKLSRPAAHVVIEANPRMAPVLRENARLNGCSFRVINKALAYDADYVNLSIDDEFVGSSVHQIEGAGVIAVETTTLAAVAAEAGFESFGVVCDIEGLESALIEREIVNDRRVKYLLAEMHPKILGEDAVRRLLGRLLDAGFDLKGKMGDVVFFAREQRDQTGQ